MRKHLPDVDVATVGGWSERSSLKSCYQQADMATMVAVVNASVRTRLTKGIGGAVDQHFGASLKAI
jgi:hypothetical protein